MLSTSSAASVNVSAATYNILGQQHDEGSNLQSWSSRKTRVFSKIADLDPGIIGMQEVISLDPYTGASSPQRSDVVAFMSKKDYSSYTGSSQNSDPLFWKKDKFTLISKKEVLIVAQDSKAKGPAARYLTYVRIKKGKQYISVFNYHYNQFRDQKVQLDKLKKQYNALKGKGDNVLFTGDFNGYDLAVRNVTGLWRVDDYDGIDHVMATTDVYRKSWVNTGYGDPKASDHPLIGVSVSLQ